MSDYTKTTDFLSKDTLLSGDPNKTVLGAEIDTEFDNIATAIATKSDSAGTLAQFAATTSAQLAGVLSDETGSGAAVFANTPTLVTPVLGTPTSGTLTNCTGLPAAGVSGTALVAADIGVSVQAYDATYLNDADIGVSVQPYDADTPTVAASQAEMEAGTEAALRSMSPLRVAQAVAALGGGKVKQIVFANKTDTFSTASTSFTDLTGMSVSLTPTSASSKVALFAMVNVGGNAALFAFFKFLRDSTDILIGDSAGSRLRVNSVSTPAGAGQTMPATLLAIDSPGDTSSHTYKVQMAVGSGTGYINRTGTDTDSATWPRAASMIIAMEYQP